MFYFPIKIRIKLPGMVLFSRQLEWFLISPKVNKVNWQFFLFFIFWHKHKILCVWLAICFTCEKSLKLTSKSKHWTDKTEDIFRGWSGKWQNFPNFPCLHLYELLLVPQCHAVSCHLRDGEKTILTQVF